MELVRVMELWQGVGVALPAQYLLHVTMLN
jgi:hypothetical protein